MDEDFRDRTRRDFPPPLDQEFVRWFEDVLYDKFLRDSWDDIRVMLLLSALGHDDARWIHVALADVLDQAGKGAPEWARIEGAWRGARAVASHAKSGDPVKEIIPYLREYVSLDAKSRASQYGDERPNDPIRIADDEHTGEILERLSAEKLEGLPSPSPDVLLAWEEEHARLARFGQEIAKYLQLEERKLVALMTDENLPASEAERRLGLEAGTWRNLRKRLVRRFQNPTT